MIMADDEAMKALEGRIAALENSLAGKSRPAVEDLTDEEIATFRKVRDIVGADATALPAATTSAFVCRVCVVCTVCTVCAVCRVCRVCDFECSCGPCNVGGGIGGAGGFSQFGG